MGGSKSGGGSKDYFGHAAGIVCQGQLDFIWGILIDNELAWPSAKAWDSQVYKKKTTVIYTDGNVYRASDKTPIDPPTFPWTLFAIPWAAGTSHNGDQRLYAGNVWKAVADTAVAPPAVAPNPKLDVQPDVPVNNWVYVCTPLAWSATDKFWAANSIVAEKGRLYITASATKARPPAAPWTLWKQDLGATNPFKITIEDRGDLFIYDGRPDQELDTSDEAILNALGHPPYRNRSVVVLKNFRFGPSRTSPPEVIILGGRKPVQTLIVGDATDMDADWQVNPWCYLAEKLFHPILGAGLPLAWANAASWQAEADRCAANPQLFYISPMFTELKKLRDLAGNILSYPDGFIIMSAVATLMAGHWPHGEAAPAFDATNTIDRNDISEKFQPSSTSDGWGGTNDSVALSFRDVAAGFESRPITAPSLSNRRIVGRMQAERIDRPHIVREAQALAWVLEAAKIAGQRSNNGTDPVRAEKAASINPGSLYLFNDDALQIADVRRCVKKTISASPIGTAKLFFEKERGASPQPYTPTPGNPSAGQGPAPAPILNAQFIQIPASLGTGPNELACLATRTNELTSSMDIFYKKFDTGAWQNLGSQPGFAIAGLNYLITEGPGAWSSSESWPSGVWNQGDVIGLQSKDVWNFALQYDNGAGLVDGIEGTDYFIDEQAGTVTIIVGGNIANGAALEFTYSDYFMVKLWDSTLPVDLESASFPLTDDEVGDNKLLLILIQKDNPDLFEICSIRSIFSITTNYGIRCRRARFGTLRGGDGTHIWNFDGDYAFILFRGHLLPLQHGDFKELQRTGASATFRVTANSAWVTGELSDLYNPASNPEGLSTEWAHDFTNLYAPQLTWKSMQYDGADVADWTIRFTTAKVFQLLAEITDKNADLAHVAITLVKGEEERQVFSRNYDPTDFANALLTFQFPKDGLWKIRTDVLDHSGNQATYFFPTDGPGIRVDDSNNTADSPLVYNFTTHGSKIKALTFGLFRDNGFTVHYQVKTRGVAPDAQGAGGGVWATIVATTAVGGRYKSGTIPAFDKKKKTLYAYCTHAGLGASATVQFNL
jgi:hypothetical protein